MALYGHATWHCVGVHACVCVCACACVCAYVRAHVMREIKLSFQDAYILYSHQFPLIFFMWDYFYVFMFAGDMASCGASDRAI